MTDQNEPRAEPSPRSPLSEQLGSFISPGRDNVLLIYILYLVGMIPALGIVPIIVGFVMAPLNRENASSLERSHYEFQFRQALMGLLFVVASFVLAFVLIGFLGFVLTAVWWIVRSVKGLLAVNHGEPIADPETWAW
jgi:uncharacterized membrane protein